MKNYVFIAGFMVAGLFLQASQGQRILQRIQEEKGDISSWEHNGPTAEDIRAATKVESLAAKGSREDKLISAVKNGDLKNVETFIAQGAGLEAKDNNGMTALMIAADKGDAKIVKILIDAGANVNTKNKFNWTALFWATQNKHAEIVEILIVNGDATDKQYFKEFLQKAIHFGETQMVKALSLGSDRLENHVLEDLYSMASMGRNRNPEIFNIIEEALNKRN